MTLGLVALNIVTNNGATTGFAISGRGDSWSHFLLRLIIGSPIGPGTQLTFVGLVRLSSIQMATAIGIWLAFIFSEIVSAYGFFRENFTRIQWAGVRLVFLGLLVLIWGRP